MEATLYGARGPATNEFAKSKKAIDIAASSTSIQRLRRGVVPVEAINPSGFKEQSHAEV